jgi:hypothetical protein
VDVTDATGVIDASCSVAADFGRVDVLVSAVSHCAARGYHFHITAVPEPSQRTGWRQDVGIPME